MIDRNDLGRALACAALLCACQSSDSGAPLGKADVGPVVGAGFSAALRADLSKATGMPMPAAAAASSGTAGTAGGSVATSGSAATTATAGAAGKEPAATTAAAAGKGAAGTTAGSAAATSAGSAAAGTASGAAASGTEVAATAPTTPATATAATTPPTTAAASAGTAAGLSPELAAVKLTLNEGWLRDSVGPGTFSFFAPGEGGKNIRFVFQYGYEDATAPTQREPYKTWLQTNKSINVTVDRQRGAAWFLEGTDAQNAAIFRYVITYGGRLLTCGGSLYKSGPGAGLRDLRDEIIMQAKRICESMDVAST